MNKSMITFTLFIFGLGLGIGYWMSTSNQDDQQANKFPAISPEKGPLQKRGHNEILVVSKRVFF